MSDWGGFNVPGHIVEQFWSLFKNDLLEKEEHLFSHLPSMSAIGADFYVIGMYNKDSLDHELAHALYYLNNDYFKTMDDLVESLPKTTKEKIKVWLLKHGYSKPQVQDEIHAYLTTDPQSVLVRRFGKAIGNNYKRIEPFRKTYELHSGRKLPDFGDQNV